MVGYELLVRIEKHQCRHVSPLVQNAVDDVVPGCEAMTSVKQFRCCTTQLRKLEKPHHRGVERLLVLGGLFTAPISNASFNKLQVVVLGEFVDDQ